ncbi:MAG: hypothetical protein IT225_06010 [Flavobacteriales bacterium]|jgi:hypothetical protein|nr:hypothetical protein [Flavobacteriales bacterium]
MTFTAKVLPPENGKLVQVEFTWPDGYEILGTEEDLKDGRFFICFLGEAPGRSSGSNTFDTQIQQNDDKTNAHSLTAIAILGAGVKAQDRRLVKDGRKEA